MGNFVCKICGAECESKCPNCRSIFLDNDKEGQLWSVLKFKLVKADYNAVVQDDNERNIDNWVQIHIYPMTSLEADTPHDKIVKGFKALHHFIEMMLEQKEGYPSVEQYTCMHEWTLKEGCTPRIDCGCWDELLKERGQKK